jgi:hypothetical protein
MKKRNSGIRDQVFLKLFVRNDSMKLTDDEVEYFREHPREISELSAPVNVHKFFLLIGTLLGIFFVGLSKVMKFSSFLNFLSDALSEFIIDVVFEIGVALIGAAATAYLLGILLNKQQINAKKWRAELRKRIKQTKKVK